MAFSRGWEPRRISVGCFRGSCRASPPQRRGHGDRRGIDRRRSRSSVESGLRAARRIMDVIVIGAGIIGSSIGWGVGERGFGGGLLGAGWGWRGAKRGGGG